MTFTSLKPVQNLAQSLSKRWSEALDREKNRINKPPPLVIRSRGIVIGTTLDNLDSLLTEYGTLSIALPNRLNAKISPSDRSDNTFKVKVFGAFEKYVVHSNTGVGGISTIEYLGESPQGKKLSAQVTSPLSYVFDCNVRSSYGHVFPSNDHVTLEPLSQSQAIATITTLKSHRYAPPPPIPSISRTALDALAVSVGL